MVVCSCIVQASILGHLEKEHLLSLGTCYVEFGAGRGKLSHWIQLAMPGHHSNQYVLVDRSNCRRKVLQSYYHPVVLYTRVNNTYVHVLIRVVYITLLQMDSYHKADDAGPSFTRLLMDIEHLNLGVCVFVTIYVDVNLMI